MMNKSYQNGKGMVKDITKNKLKSEKKGGFKKFNFIEEEKKMKIRLIIIIKKF